MFTFLTINKRAFVLPMRATQHLLALFLACTAVLAQEIKVLRLGLHVRIQQVTWCPEMELGKITPESFPRFILALKCCRVERALVGGWMDHTGDYVLHDNGTVVPAEDLTRPSVALYTMQNCSGADDVICVCHGAALGDPTCYRVGAVVTQRRTCVAAISDQLVVEATAMGYNCAGNLEPDASSCYAYPAYCSPVTPCPEQPCEPSPDCCKPTPDCYEPTPDYCEPSPDCKPDTRLAQRKLNACRTPCGKQIEAIDTSRTFIFAGSGCANQGTVLKVRSRQDKRKQEVISLSSHRQGIVPKVLRSPKRLAHIRDELQRAYGSQVVLYVNSKNQLFAQAQQKLYQVSMCHKKITTVPVNRSRVKSLVCCGLSDIAFEGSANK
ncbi:hypothetical protein PAPHI01_1930 [Pancytospora philotis]|nr:hypothetical protein PAPHI01_1930 [Pancytospora philotis]